MNLARMTIYEDPELDMPLEERILLALSEDRIRTFSQLEVLCGLTDPKWATNPEQFSSVLDKTLRDMISVGKVVLAAKRPELCFRAGTVLDRLAKETGDGGQGTAG